MMRLVKWIVELVAAATCLRSATHRKPYDASLLAMSFVKSGAGLTFELLTHLDLPVLRAALINPFLNTDFNLLLMWKLLAPPVTEIRSFGVPRFHCLLRSCNIV